MSWLTIALATAISAPAATTPHGAAGFERATFWFVHPGLSPAEITAQVDAFARSGINGVILGGGRHHYLHDDLPYLEAQIAVTRQVVEACHARGILVCEHHSVVACTDQQYGRRHADWIQRDFATGDPSVWPEYQMWAFCPNNQEFREHYWAILADLVRRTGVDAVMCDDTVFHHGCACAACARRWREEVGGDLRQAYAASRQVGTPEWRRWNAVRQRWFGDFRHWLFSRLRQELPSVRCFVLLGSILSPWGHQTHGGSTEASLRTAVAGWWEIYNPADFYSWRRLAAEASALAEAARQHGVAVVALPYADRAEQRDHFDPEEELFMWGLAQAHGLSFTLSRVFLTGLTASDAPRAYFTFERDQLAPFTPSEPAGTIGVVFSHACRDTDPQWETFHTAPAIAWAQALLDANLPYRAVTGETLTAGLPEEVRTLILPNFFAVSAVHLQRLEQFVADGGCLVASFQTGTHDETGAPRLTERADRLRKLLGVRLRSLDWSNDPTVGRPRAAVELSGLERLPGPLEVYRHQVGRGTVLYLPTLVELSAFLDQVTETKPFPEQRDRALAAALAKLALEFTPQQPVRITRGEGAGHLLTTVRRVPGKLLVHVLNTAGADLAAGTPVPAPSRVVWAPPTTLTLALPRAPRRVRVLSPDAADARVLNRPSKTVTLPSPRRYELIVIEQ